MERDAGLRFDLDTEAKAGQSTPFLDIPGFPAPTVVGHGGKLVFCEFEGRKVVLQAGRFHFYEGNPMPTVVAPMRLYGRLGVKASGGMPLSLSVIANPR